MREREGGRERYLASSERFSSSPRMSTKGELGEDEEGSRS